MKVEIWSDVTCPSCYTAKRNFEKALSEFDNATTVEIIWKSFQLAPELKTDENIKLPEFLALYKGIPAVHIKSMMSQVTDNAKRVGLEFNLANAIPANTFNAHRLSHLAKQYGLQDKAEESLLRAYFTDGENIDDIGTLTKLGMEIGLTEAEIVNVLEDNKFADEVRNDLEDAERRGINAVPHFLFNGKQVVSGAQGSEVFLNALKNTFAEWEKQNASCRINEVCI